MECPLAMACISFAELRDLHIWEECSSLREFIEKVGGIGMLRVDGFSSPHAPSEPDNYDVRATIAWPMIKGACQSESGEPE